MSNSEDHSCGICGKLNLAGHECKPKEETFEEAVEADLIAYGFSIVRYFADGSSERIDPTSIYIKHEEVH